MMIETLDPRAAGGHRLQGKVCIVTGAGQGIGRATARRFAAEGAKVVIAERVAETAQETLQQLTDAGAEACSIIADISRFAEAERLMAETVARYGSIDVLANVVGGTIWWQPYGEYTEEQILLELERSLHTTLWCCHAVLKQMVSQKSGSIINFGSSVTRSGLYRTPYAVSKGGIEALTKTLAAEYGRYGIRVNGVAPGVTIIQDRKTSRLVLRPGEVAEATQNTDSLVRETRDLAQPSLGRTGSAEEQAAVAAFLACDDSSFITGHMIPCDGGVK